MPYRINPPVTDHYYHVYNRGIDGMAIFKGDRDYQRFITLLNYYRFANLSMRLSHLNQMSEINRNSFLEQIYSTYEQNIDILCYCLMPNHYHLMLRQRVDGGISTFMRILQNAYAQYFNTKYKRKGRLIQSEFQYLLIESDEQSDHVSRYIHLNPATSQLVSINQLESYRYSSYPTYLGRYRDIFVSDEFIIQRFSSRDEYKSFVLARADFQRELNKIKLPTHRVCGLEEEEGEEEEG